MVPADLRVALPERVDVPRPEPMQKKTVWKSVKKKVGPIAAAATLPLRAQKTSQFDVAGRLTGWADADRP